MKIAAVIVRTLMGLLFLFASVTYLFNLVPQPELAGNMKIFSDGMAASGYLLALAKIVELVCGVAFVSGRFVTLAAVLIAPVTVNIFFISVFLDPRGLPVSVFLVLSNLFLGYYYRDNYKTLFAPK
jgi:uncharacterized membrane protein YphA (DoxX/SURF4 family)